MIKPMNLHLLRLFAAVGEHRHVSQAAAALRISQPAVSRGIRELEKQLDVALLDRGSRTVRLTEAGEVLHRHAIAIFRQEAAAEEELRAHLGLSRGRLRVGASTTVSMYYLPALLARFYDAHPNVEIELTSANTAEIARGLLEYQFDLALVEGPVRQEQLLVRRWREDTLVLIASLAHPLAKRDRSTPVRVEELSEYPWAARESGSGTQAVVDRYLETRGIRPRSLLRLNSTEAIKRAVEASRSLLSYVSAKSIPHAVLARRLVVLPLEGAGLKRALNFLSINHRPPSPAAKAFIEELERSRGTR